MEYSSFLASMSILSRLGSQALLAALQQNSCNRANTKADRASANDLFQSVLNDEFLYLLHFHHDLHECALGLLKNNYSDSCLTIQCMLGPITKLMQHDKLSYYHLMEEIKQKRNMLSQWISPATYKWGPTLANYIKATGDETFGAFKIKLGNRQEFAKQCADHIERLLKELDRRFAPSPIQENMSVLFDPHYLIAHKNDIDSPDYGRSSLDFLRDKYKNLDGFDSNAVLIEWESLKQPLSHFVDVFPTSEPEETFWQKFIVFKSSISSQFIDGNKNVLLLLGIYLISPTNSAECERGVSSQLVLMFNR